ncbi:collagen alpha-1(I) chain-like [Enhydra lutris kenyoni]|uniref:Collagen alpha-1(I) chain-like n=1 Tax=Enhydra lutris kenyoni TaxID=391180 RepID=A0A2Y9JL61_ENHLU|nr:collagen alpha-1(I) chain-like [Enhydra lutris kenyoni]
MRRPARAAARGPTQGPDVRGPRTVGPAGLSGSQRPVGIPDPAAPRGGQSAEGGRPRGRRRASSLNLHAALACASAVGPPEGQRGPPGPAAGRPLSVPARADGPGETQASPAPGGPSPRGPSPPARDRSRARGPCAQEGRLLRAGTGSRRAAALRGGSEAAAAEEGGNLARPDPDLPSLGPLTSPPDGSPSTARRRSPHSAAPHAPLLPTGPARGGSPGPRSAADPAVSHRAAAPRTPRWSPRRCPTDPAVVTAPLPHGPRGGHRAAAPTDPGWSPRRCPEPLPHARRPRSTAGSLLADLGERPLQRVS